MQSYGVMFYKLNILNCLPNTEQEPQSIVTMVYLEYP